ncbi:MAG: hypothetical protein U5K84_06960 [Alkalibacterium sp.]|nr:hypothetical protein [Alkalibacterium sp.]
MLTDLLRGTGFDKYSSYLNKSGNMNIDLAKLTGQIVAALDRLCSSWSKH